MVCDHMLRDCFDMRRNRLRGLEAARTPEVWFLCSVFRERFLAWIFTTRNLGEAMNKIPLFGGLPHHALSGMLQSQRLSNAPDAGGSIVRHLWLTVARPASGTLFRGGAVLSSASALTTGLASDVRSCRWPPTRPRLQRGHKTFLATCDFNIDLGTEARVQWQS
jgi:hypothetical protein